MKAFNLLSEYKNYHSTKNNFTPDTVAFMQSEQDDQSYSEWEKNATCHNCNKKGHIRPNCPLFKTSDNDDEKTECQKKSEEKEKKEKERKEKEKRKNRTRQK